MSWAEVDRWRAAVRALSPRDLDVPDLSGPVARFALDAALDALDDVPRHLDRRAPAHTAVVCASTVFTAPLEWAAVLLARGGAVTLKSPRGLERWFDAVADATRLPLAATTDRAVLRRADRVVAMGSDATLAALRAELAPGVLLGFGHRFSVAWWTDPAQADALALDLALFDGRGCMSPVAVFSPIPDAGVRLAAALDRVEARLPRGAVRPAEAARIRERVALARVLGAARIGSASAVLELPIDRFEPTGLPRVVPVHACDRAGFVSAIRHVAHELSTIGTDETVGLGVRESPLGWMQRPPLDRLHDGVDWLRVV